MQCPKHGSKMTLLLTSYVCDECDPPKQVQVKPVTRVEVHPAFDDAIADAETVASNIFGRKVSLVSPVGEVKRNSNFPGMYWTMDGVPVELIVKTTLGNWYTTHKVAVWQKTVPSVYLERVMSPANGDLQDVDVFAAFK